MAFSVVGQSVPRVDGEEKVTGRTQFVADQEMRGLLHARLFLSPYAHARIRRIPVAAARAVPGVVAVLTADDLPFGDAVPNVRGRCLLARGEVRFAGDPVAVVVAETEEAAADGLERLASGAEFDPLPALVDPVAAADPGAPLVQPGLSGKSAEASLHAAVKVEEESNDQRPSNVASRVRFVRGDIERGLRESALVVGRTFRTSVVHQAYIEPHATTAAFDPSSRRLTVWTATQGLFYSRENVAQVLGLPESSVRIVPMAVGGGFGAKILLLEPLAGALAMLLGRPVRVVLTRSDEFRTATPAPQSTLEVRLGARRDGTLVAIQAQLLFDAGALPGAPLNIAALMLGGNYQAPHLDIQGREILTHKAPIGAYRAPGAPQAAFALESVLDDLARGLGLDPIEFRLRNASQGGDPMPSGEPWPRIGLREALQAVQEDPLWRNRERNGRGIGVAAGGWLGGLEPASACIRLNTDGGAQVIVGSVDISGTATGLAQIAAEMLGLPVSRVRLVGADSDSAPYAGMSGGSKIIYSVGSAVVKAAEDARRQLLALAARRLEASEADLEITGGVVGVRGVPARTIAVADLVKLTSGFGAGNPPIFGVASEAIVQRAPAFGAHVARIQLDADSGRVRVVDYAVAQDVGRAINPAAVRGQIHGGVAQGVGWALLERMLYDEQGSVATGTFLDYALPRATDVPPIRITLVEVPSERGPYGAKGVGEPPVVPVAAAIANAIMDASGARVEELPIVPESVVAALRRAASA
ncbi:MAG TPA: xanthine dehydrogenase family protein molybdopterin-binding subunit [bacterium]